MSENPKPPKTTIALDASEVAKIKDILLEDFRSGEIDDVDMSPSGYVRDLIVAYNKYRDFCRESGIPAQKPENLFTDYIEVLRISEDIAMN